MAQSQGRVALMCAYVEQLAGPERMRGGRDGLIDGLIDGVVRPHMTERARRT